MTAIPSRIGPYPVEREVGRGGMGVVYLARDTRLDRRVAIKVLPEAFATDPERLARFEREARLVASLNHPNIAGIYGLEEAEGRRFLALEYVEGDTLGDRLARGPLALDDALDVCRQVAAALEAAHEGGVVHRDLKPGNIKVTPAGEVKVLDFGLAKGGAGSESASSPDLSQSPTLTHAATGVGVILGTAAYMSPEQARGRAVDKRADIWAFGCVLFECLSGRQAFVGETVSDMIAKILQGEPDWGTLPAQTPERIRGLLRRCFEKDARRRVRDIGDARIEIEDVQAVRASSSALRAGTAPARRGAGGWLSTAAVVVLTAALTWFLPRLWSRPTAPVAMRFEVPQPEGTFLNTDAGAPRISPDGRTLVFEAADSTGELSLWVRPLESTVSKRIPGTEKAAGLFWSPDSRQIGFFAQDKLRKVAIAGGEPEIVCPVTGPRGGTWNAQGVILLAPTPNGPIVRVPAGGGESQPVTTLDSTRGETAHRHPQFLPDGRHFLFSVLPARNGNIEIHVGSIDSPRRRLLLSVPSGVAFGGGGHLVYARNGKLVAQGFDARGLRLLGEPILLADLTTTTSSSGGPVASIAANGTLVHPTFRQSLQRLVWYDALGRNLGPVPLPPGPYSPFSLSPDDRRAAIARTDAGENPAVWIADLERGVATRFADEPGSMVSPQWSPDGTRIAYMHFTPGAVQVLRVRAVDGDSVETFLAADPMFKRLHGWSPDGRCLLYSRQDPVTQWDLWLLPMEGDREPRPYLRNRFVESNVAVSPDGRWLAYQSDESGTGEAYVQSFPTPGGKYQVTTGGGAPVGWGPGGRSLYYARASSQTVFFEAPVLPGPGFRLGPPRSFQLDPNLRGGAMANDGRRFLLALPADKDPTPSHTVVLNALTPAR